MGLLVRCVATLLARGVGMGRSPTAPGSNPQEARRRLPHGQQLKTKVTEAT